MEVNDTLVFDVNKVSLRIIVETDSLSDENSIGWQTFLNSFNVAACSKMNLNSRH